MREKEEYYAAILLQKFMRGRIAYNKYSAEISQVKIESTFNYFD